MKFSKTFGQVEVVSEDATFTVIKLENGDVKKLATKFAFLKNEPFSFTNSVVIL